MTIPPLDSLAFHGMHPGGQRISEQHPLRFNAHLTCIAISKSAELGRPVRINGLKLIVE